MTMTIRQLERLADLLQMWTDTDEEADRIRWEVEREIAFRRRVTGHINRRHKGPLVMMTKRELERLSDLLGKWHGSHPDDGDLRDKASMVRFMVDEELEERFDV